MHGSVPFDALRRPRNRTVRDALVAEGHEGGERLVGRVGFDGIDLRQYHSFDTVRDFGTSVTPLLRERGRLPERYTDGETLRQRVQGGGSSRLPDRHPAARHRVSRAGASVGG